MSEGFFWKSKYGDQVTPDMTGQERELRDLFVREYLVDFDSKAAAIRCGFVESYAEQYAVQFMGETYVRKRITELSHSTEEKDDAEKEAATRQRILTSLFREANYRGPGSSHGARIAALSKLASLHGMDVPTKVEQTINHKGGVMTIPAVGSLAEWEEQAMASQEKLVSEAES